jgi:hypothetical protein
VQQIDEEHSQCYAQTIVLNPPTRGRSSGTNVSSSSANDAACFGKRTWGAAEFLHQNNVGVLYQ